MLYFCFLTPKRHILARNRVVWHITHEYRFRGLGCRPLEETRQKKKPSKHLWCALLCIRVKESPWWIVTKFCMWVDIRDVIKYATFGCHYLPSDWLERPLWGRLTVARDHLHKARPRQLMIVLVYCILSLFYCVIFVFSPSLCDNFLLLWHDIDYLCWKCHKTPTN